jgi:4-amino-4-deoxy-L-arabinose transferase-like glycosyltransferase
MIKRFVIFIRNNFPWIMLVLYGLFIIFYKWSGSFMGDEAIYSQVAKESLSNHSYLVLHWKGQLWFEKPPLIIWLTALSFKFFGISETSAHIFPGIFSILSAAILYKLGKELFKSKLAGFFSGFVFLTSPIIFLYSRVNMMDIPAGMFLALSFFAIWKIFEGHSKWWIIFGLTLGLTVMAKGVVGLLPLLALAPLVIIFKKRDAAVNIYSVLGLLIFLAIGAPWHIFMSLKFGMAFWKDYFGFHIFERFFYPILPYPWENNSWLAYFKLFFERSGIWIWIFAILALGILASLLISFLNRQKYFTKNYKAGNILKKINYSYWMSWTRDRKNQLIFLSVWFLAVFLPFFLAETKLPNYMILAYFPMAILTGGFLDYIFESLKLKALLFLSALSLLNFLPSFRLRASDFGEAHILFPKILVRYLNLSDTGLIWILILSLVLILVFFQFFRKKPAYILNFSLFILIGMNLLVPFNPYRNEFIKGLGRDISSLSQNQLVVLYTLTKPAQYSFNNVGAFYLPVGSKIESLGKRQLDIKPKNETKDNQFCFIEKSFASKQAVNESILPYNEGTVVNCSVSE